MDRTYHDRHPRKAKYKAGLIGPYIDDKCEFMLDIGCNRGAISALLLKNHQQLNITGIDLKRSALLNELINHPRFNFVEGNVVNRKNIHMHDVTLYLAVHHHIVHHYGMAEALHTLRRFAKSTRSHLFFETGKIIESGYWKWQPALRKHFRFDEEHYYSIIESIEDLIDSWCIVGVNYIHGVRREIIKFNMAFHNDQEDRIPLYKEKKSHKRLWDTKYIEQNSNLISEGSTLNIRRKLREDSGSCWFLKRHIARPMAQYREFLLSNAVREPWCIAPLGWSQDGEWLIYPFHQSSSIYKIKNHCNKIALEDLREQLRAIRAGLKLKKAECPVPLFPHKTKSYCLYEVCDINPSNILVKLDELKRPNIVLCDLSYQAPSYSWRNDISFYHSEKLLFGISVFSLWLLLKGYCCAFLKSLHMQCRTKSKRIRERFPSLFSIVITVFIEFGWKIWIALKR